MNEKEFKDNIISIDPSANCLKFLCYRILRNDYRGVHKLQHYRWSAKYIKIVLKHLSKNELLYHTTGDITNSYRYKENEIPFLNYLKSVNSELLEEKEGSITDMGMRKIIFVNLHRMGFIDRFTHKGIKCDINKTYRNYRYVKITQKGIDFVQAKNIFEEQKILGLALDFLFDGLVQDILDILNSLERPQLSISEMMFFVSYLGKEYQGNIITKDTVINLINEFRSLQARQKVVEHVINDFCNPKKFKGNKLTKRDYGNWKNESQSIFNGLGLMSLFEYDTKTKKLFLKAQINGEDIKFKRSATIKEEYFYQHKVAKDIRFELHHIIPFYFAKDIDMLKAIDDWRNLIYIDSNSHSILSRDKEAKYAIRLSFENVNVILDDFNKYKLYLLFDENIKYNISLQKRLVEYNKLLIGGL